MAVPAVPLPPALTVRVYSVITVQSYPTTRSQLVAIVLPGQSSEVVMKVDIGVGVQVVLDIDICDLRFQC